MLPDGPRLELMESMASFGACGFHTARWRDAFVRCASATGVAAPATFVAPLGADAARLDEVAATRGLPVAPRAARGRARRPHAPCCAATGSSSRRT